MHRGELVQRLGPDSLTARMAGTPYDGGGIGLVNGTRKVGTSHYGARHGGVLGNDGGAFCWDCHQQKRRAVTASRNGGTEP